MLGAMSFITRHAINFIISFTVLTVTSFTLADITIFFVPVLTIASYFISNKAIKVFQKSKRSKEIGISNSEYKHIESQLKIARGHLNSLTQQYIRVRSLRSFKLLNEMTKLSKRIINIVQTNPQKFYSVEDFFYSHLPSAVQLIQTYTMLTQQQIKDSEIHLALEDTRKTLKELHGTMEQDLKSALESDLESLRMELDFVKLQNEKKRQQIEFRGDNQ
ncbi:5-bromo-4-chloroindolyl phosphate hydrolysis family protein [Lysinibacillus endophyticus]|uniref:5-bromo-4-chloroindolyl phosphate hydrolase n=1 Tax=Ureibacillus endophyticus TaxID=1978490 RepID=A0A494Z6Z0_9BACL|nr:5-bromo-4-chloroindolyl phosphate hydrolysis family protein [Lysinibacillus endophyticus]MCP1144662.1 5-bromo-4-chloroindolyl phosphate hydrolysis family protein [Lysinibacillus endophyticus]RKQ18347.1 5-bromo-4-chloroindolyl phosphate hydrolase [Lysinibacillus endophyticus]